MVSHRNRLGMSRAPLFHYCSTSRQKNAQHRTHDPLLRQADSLTARCIVGHSGRSLPRCGTFAPRRRLPPGPTQLECERTGGWLWDASGRESGFCELGRQQFKRAGDAYQQPGGPDPDIARHVFGFRPSLRRGPYHGLWHMGKLSR